MNCLPGMDAAVAKRGSGSHLEPMWRHGPLHPFWPSKVDELLGRKNRVLCQGQEDHREARGRTERALAKKPHCAEAGVAAASKWPVGCQKPTKKILGSKARFAEAGTCRISLRDEGGRAKSEWRPAQGFPLCLLPEGVVSSPFRAQ